MYTKEEQKEHRKRLIEVLRSDEYEQSTGKLREDNSFCCLGVACDISGLGRWLQDGMYVAKDGDYEDGDYDELELPTIVQDYYGFTHPGGGFIPSDKYPAPDGSNPYQYLTNLNDTYGYTFAKIADVIEEEPEGLVV